jgi:hypothetical protein
VKLWDCGLPFATSLDFWGAHWLGDAAEQDACLAEGPRASQIEWDATLSDLLGIQRWHGERCLPAPDWWAFRYLSIGEMDWALELEEIEP